VNKSKGERLTLMMKSSAKYKILYSKNAKRDVKKLDIVARRKVGKKILFYFQSPFDYARKLTDSEIGNYKWRIGKIRVTFDFDGETISILRIRYRKEVYK
jgi:mRNA-degrading endonuclease RelE of RelBE toxin-antitoxin system